jgi:hypothetical protein
MKHVITAAILALALSACTHEIVKPNTKWNVKTSTESEQKIWVTRADGSRQCGQGKGQNPTQVAAQVQQAGLLVFQSRLGKDGQMHPQMCGAPTGRTIDLEISKLDIRKALSLGFVTKDEASATPEAN